MTGRQILKLRAGFTLVELLVVIGIIALLVSILLPALARARAQANAVRCMAQLQQISTGLVLYSTNNHGYVVPSYNMPFAPGETVNNNTGGPDQPIEGWASILDRDGYVRGNPEKNTNTVFYCPETFDVEGIKDGQTGTDLGKPRGWTDWPMIFTTVGGDSAPKQSITIPAMGYNKIIRVSYWINAYNPIGSAPASIPAADLYYTASVGVGPDLTPQKNYIRLHKTSNIKYPSRMIVVCDGLYMGRQTVGRWGDANSRIGYRHRGKTITSSSDVTKTTNVSVANVGFADGHVESITGDQFPRAYSSADAATLTAQKKAENMIFTTYAEPERIFP